jgi:hypothetical protein
LTAFRQLQGRRYTRRFAPDALSERVYKARGPRKEQGKGMNG